MSRKAVIKEIESLVAPHLRDSGYRKPLDPSKGILGGSRPLRLWAPKEPIRLDGFVMQDVIAVTEDGVIDDATGGGAMQSGFGCFPLEDLKSLRNVLRRELAT
jgi:hypothetical protein